MKLHSLFTRVVLLVALLGLARDLIARTDYLDPDSRTGTSLAVTVDQVPLAHTAQFLPMNDRGELVGRGDVRQQTERVLDRLDAALRRAESGSNEIVKLNVYVVRAELTADVSMVLARRFAGAAKPAVTFVGGSLPHPDALVAMDAVAVARRVPAAGVPLTFPGVERKNFSDVSILPATDVVYVAGMADKSDLGPATKVTLRKIVDALGHLGLQRRDIVQLKAFLQPMTRVLEAERAFAEFFAGEIVPPIVYVEWISPDTPIEIEAIVAAPAAKSDRNVTYVTPPGATRSPVFSRLARVHSGRRIYVSGLYGNSDTDVVEIFRQLDGVLERAGGARDRLVKATYYYSDPKANARLDAFRPGYFDPATPPAASKARTRDVGQPGKGILIDMIGATK